MSKMSFYQAGSMGKSIRDVSKEPRNIDWLYFRMGKEMANKFGEFETNPSITKGRGNVFTIEFKYGTRYQVSFTGKFLDISSFMI